MCRSGHGIYGVAQGFVKPNDAEFAKKMARKINASGGLADFETCARDPRACQNFVPEENREEFQKFEQLEQIMKQELGFDPRECERGEFDQNIGLRCLEGSKRALPKLEALAANSPQVKAIVDEIKGHVARGDDLAKRKDQFNQVFQTQGGPGGCRSPQECSAYCSDPAHGPECIAFGAKQGIRDLKEAKRFRGFKSLITPFRVSRARPQVLKAVSLAKVLILVFTHLVRVAFRRVKSPVSRDLAAIPAQVLVPAPILGRVVIPVPVRSVLRPSSQVII